MTVHLNENNKLIIPNKLFSYKFFKRFLKNKPPTKENLLKISNRVAFRFMLFNLVGQIYFKYKKDALWSFKLIETKVTDFPNPPNSDNNDVNDYLKNLSFSNNRLYLSESYIDSIKYKYPIRYKNLKYSSIYQGKSLDDYALKSKQKISNLMIGFTSITALSHFFLYSLIFKRYKKYVLKKKINPYRWIEYSLTSSIMLAAMLGLTGITDIEEFVPLILLTWITPLIGLAIESIKGEEKYLNNIKKLLFLSGVVTQGYPWYIILKRTNSGLKIQKAYFNRLNTILNSDIVLQENVKTEFKKGIKTYRDIEQIIKVVNYSLFGLYFSFPIIMYNQYFNKKLNRNKDNYFYGELQYILSSVLNKSVLSWLIFGGAFRIG